MTSLSRFTPSVMPYEVLERLFVARTPTLDALMERIDQAASSTSRNHSLLVGPRGAGKTHLVSLAYHRARERPGAQVAWLPEDPWKIVSYARLLESIVKHLEPTQDLPDGGSEELEAVLRRRAAKSGPIVVFLENLDVILDALGNEGQQRLRHLLQSDRSLLLVATTTRLDRSLSDQAEPFYGFFTATRLEPFDGEQAGAMLKAIAAERDDADLVEYLDTAEGRARVRTIAHLAGGQPRIWALLATALTVEGLDDLVDLLLTRFDDLTPYYQSQLDRLSPHQRLVVIELAEIDRPIAVKELAERTGVDQRSLSKTLHELDERGWVKPAGTPLLELLDRRLTYYELAEPLVRLAFQLKETRGGAVPLVVDFLKLWFSPAELDGSGSDAVAPYLASVLGSDAITTTARRLRDLTSGTMPIAPILEQIDDGLAALRRGDPKPLLQVPSPVRRAVEERVDGTDLDDARTLVHTEALREVHVMASEAVDGWVRRAEAWQPDPGRPRWAPMQLLVRWLCAADRLDEASEVTRAISELSAPDPVPALEAARWIGARLDAQYRYRDALREYDRLVPLYIEIEGEDSRDVISLRACRALLRARLGMTEAPHELGLLQRQSDELFGEQSWNPCFVAVLRAHALVALGRRDEAVRDAPGIRARLRGLPRHSRSRETLEAALSVIVADE